MSSEETLFSNLITNGFTTPDSLKNPVKVNKIDAQHESRRSENWWSKNYQGILEPEMKKNKILINKILKFGGHEVCMPLIEEDFKNIINRGVFIYGHGACLIKGNPSDCHRNSCAIYENDGSGDIIIMTGYALSSDGLWRQHSWCYDMEIQQVIETTKKRVAYFGFPMTHDEADDFCFDNF